MVAQVREWVREHGEDEVLRAVEAAVSRHTKAGVIADDAVAAARDGAFDAKPKAWLTSSDARALMCAEHNRVFGGRRRPGASDLQSAARSWAREGRTMSEVLAAIRGMKLDTSPADRSIYNGWQHVARNFDLWVQLSARRSVSTSGATSSLPENVKRQIADAIGTEGK